jgi:DNA modification methylase
VALALSWRLLGGDCRHVLAQIDEASVDACVTDPPYELGFMGRAWDRSGVAFDVETWRAVLRVLKPGAHLLAFGGTRTVHRIACAIEDAGFDIRDQLQWLYGSGFPKSKDVSKAIDEAAGAAREVIGHAENFGASKAADGKTGFGDYAGQWNITAPATDAARAWAGWGTALKPACEPIVLARKPLIGTVAANVLAHGTGALNVDACRIETDDNLNGGAYSVGARGSDLSGAERTSSAAGMFAADGGRLPGQYEQPAGRWPANVLLDEEAARLLDEQSGERKSGSMRAGTYAGRKSDVYQPTRATPLERDIIGSTGSTGGASRFFYVAKASRRERDAGCEHLPETRRTDGRKTENEFPKLRTSKRKNYHPTVKPIDVMRWLVRLVTPPGGLVLDPFAGSGTTGIAALREGMRFVGVDLEPEYARIAIARIEEDAPLFNRRRAP